MLAITGATGQLGRLTIKALLDRGVEPSTIVAAVRDTAKAADLKGQGLTVREADYNRPETLRAAFEGVDRVLLISSSEVTRDRVAQHRAVIDAAKAAGVKLLAYTSILHADTSPLKLARDHKATEDALKASGLPHVLLRNGWYTENNLLGLKPTLEHGALVGGAGGGRISFAARADYAAAAAAALTEGGQAGQVHELAGDEGLTLEQYAGLIGKAAGKPIAYRDMAEADYRGMLAGAGLPAAMAEMIADADARAADGALEDTSRAMSRLIGRPTTPVAETIAAAVKG